MVLHSTPGAGSSFEDAGHLRAGSRGDGDQDRLNIVLLDDGRPGPRRAKHVRRINAPTLLVCRRRP